jgi:hypothetical protein
MKTYCIVFRTGGTLNFKWRRSLPMSYDEAIIALSAEKKAGRINSMICDYDKSVSIGLPETFDANIANMIACI